MVGLAMQLFCEMVDSREKGTQTSSASGMSPHKYLSLYIYTYIVSPRKLFFHTSRVLHWAVMETTEIGIQTTVETHLFSLVYVSIV
jgi:hypothetical protein